MRAEVCGLDLSNNCFFYYAIVIQANRMQSSCPSESGTSIQPPQLALFNIERAKNEPIFDFKGAPLTIPPRSVSGLQEKIRKNIPNPYTQDINYFVDANYFTVNLNTSNIIDAQTANMGETTIKYPNTSDGFMYDLKFICMHKNLFGTSGDTRAQLSLVFQSRSAAPRFFHICIPVTGSPISGNQRENLFLQAWLKPSNPNMLPPGFTMNEVLNFRDGAEKPIEFTTVQYCLQLDTLSDTQASQNKKFTYHLCIFNTPLYIAQNNLPDWLARDFQMTASSPEPTEQITGTYMRKDFALIFNLMMRGMVRKNLGNWGSGRYGVINQVRANDLVIEPNDYRQISTTNFIDTNPFTSAPPTPEYYLVQNGKLVKTTPIKSAPGKRSLGGIKCYPIDLANQVDDQGNIVIDEETKKPLDVFEARETMSAKDQEELTKTTLKQQDFLENALFWILFVVLLLIFMIIIGVTVIRVFPGSSFSKFFTSSSTG